MYRSDIYELHNLVDFVRSLPVKKQGVYILASGNVLNSSIVAALDKPFASTSIDNLNNTADVDLRDGFPVSFLSSNIIVTTNPTQLHLNPGSQMVVEYLHDEITDTHSYIGRHFKKLEKTFTLEDGIEAIVYQKISSFSSSDLQTLADYYDSLYPTHRELFRDRILSMRKNDN